jgi:hypothetical protein
VYYKNKLLAGFWELNAITLSAQILTLPIVLYHFHQFPLLFLFTKRKKRTWTCKTKSLGTKRFNTKKVKREELRLTMVEKTKEILEKCYNY